MRNMALYTLSSAGIFILSFLFLDTGAFQQAHASIREMIIPLWEHPLSSLSLIITDLGSISAAAIFLTFIVIALFIEGYRKEAYIVAASGILAALLTFVLKEIIVLPRPTAQFRIVSGSRFPSGHAASALIMALSFIYVAFLYTRSFLLRTPLVLIALSFAALVGTTRIFMNVHEPLDVIAGFAVALFSMSLILMLSQYLRESK